MIKAVKHRIEYVLVRIFDMFLSSLPRSLALGIGEGLGVFVSKVLSSRRKLVLENLAMAFPEKGKDEINRIAAGVWRNLGRTAVEFIRLPDITTKNYHKFFVYEGLENVDRAARKERGIIFTTFHFTNWEITGVAAQFARGGVIAIARPMKNPLVEKWIQKKRAESGMSIILHRQAVKESLRVLRQRKRIGILVDQNLYTGGVFVSFFGRLAATTTLPALLCSRTQAPVIMAYSLREGGRFRIIFGPPFHLPEIDDPEERIRRHTELMTEQMEAVIRRHPENWFWVHNRWKRKPEAV